MTTYSSAPKRISIPLSSNLHKLLEEWARKSKKSVAQFGREAIEQHLKTKQREATRLELEETRKILGNINEEVNLDWSITETEEWPD